MELQGNIENTNTTRQWLTKETKVTGNENLIMNQIKDGKMIIATDKSYKNDMETVTILFLLIMMKIL